MDWDLKMLPWDLAAELERGAAANMRPSFVSGAAALGRQTSGIALDCSVDLKLGGLGDSGTSSADKWRDQTRAPSTATAASPSGSAKRARAPSNGVHNAACLVDGCKSDLSNCREYHRRHKVCEVHSKTPVVMVKGQEQRFCQQCSRFHLLVEFDEGKRSCRKRLDGHNRRRRKPQPETVNSGSLFANHQGPRFSSNSQMFPTAPVPNWAAIVKTEDDALYGHNSALHFIDKQQHFPGPLSQGYKEERHFPFLQACDSVLGNRTIKTTVCQPLLNSIASSESSSNKIFSNGLTHVLDSDCALSLLSSPTQTSDINLSHMLRADQIPMGQPLVSSLHRFGCLNHHYSHSQASNGISSTGFSCSAMEDEPVGTALVSDISEADLHCQSIFHVGADRTSNGASPAIPFSWQ